VRGHLRHRGRRDVVSATLREDYLRLVSTLGLSRGVATCLVEACSGRRFEVCDPADLVPILDELLVVVRCMTRPDTESGCRE
jgi:hypothetical protein